MHNKTKLKDLQKITPTIKTNANFSKNIMSKRMSNNDNIKLYPKKHLPELKLTKLKSRPDSDTENEVRGKSLNNNQNQIKKTPSVVKKQKSHSLMKKKEVVFPKINNNNGGEDYFENKYHNNIKKLRNNNKLNIYNTNTSNMQIFSGNLLKNEKDIDSKFEKSDIQKIKNKIPKHPGAPSILNKNNNTQMYNKMKPYKKESIENNLINNLMPTPLLSYQPNIFSTPNNNQINKPILLSSNNNKKQDDEIITNINKENNINNENNNINNINNINNENSETNKLISTSSNSTISSSGSQIENELKELELMSEKLNMLHNLFSSLGPLAGLGGLGPSPQKTVELTPEIYHNTYKNFEPSIFSTKNEFSNNDLIKGYAYNSSMGNVRTYNEDTITATKIFLPNENFYFFAVYDGHGGNNCSLYLKNNLHKNINEFSVNGLKNAIEITEKDYINKEALDENNELKDSSGSCGIMAIIKNNKCIIANVGDSRLVIFKNNSINFVTEDHKPNSNVEKNRIEKAGGKIYQSPSLFPLYQNGKEIEIPWRVLPGRLSVSRTFGDIEAKNEKFGGMKNVVVALPDIDEIILNDEFSLIILGCDGIFDVLSNEELLECCKIVLKEKKMNKIEGDIGELCGEFAGMIIKSALAKDSFDNVSCVVIALNLMNILEQK